MIIFDPIERALWIIAIILMIFCSYTFLNRARKSDISEEKHIMYGFTLFVLFFSISRLIFFIADYFIIGNYSGHSYIGDISDTNPTFDYLNIIGHVVWMIGMIIFFYSFETTVSFTKYIFTIIGVLITGIVSFQINLRYFAIIYFIIVLSFILIYLSVKSSRELKGVSAFMFTGILFAAVGAFLTTWTIKEIIASIFPGIPPLLYIIGALIIISPNYLSQKYLTRALPIWILLAIFLIGFMLFTPILINIGNFPIIVVILIISLNFPALIILIYTIYRIIKIFQYKENYYDITKDDTQQKDFLKLFTKPSKLTEEEISISKEKKICLVCKNEISRENYICPKCKAFYCLKCSRTLTTMENACWVCYTPFDESKPVIMPEKKKKEDIIIDKVDHKSI
ncbi:MAG: hypothetical protein EU535_02670 [Promethearchaeota archaeon]|nr:MAG: hypothetical protein EU535_02670 [Candidatus Lokiarchaeota archaeon]